mmetsp:Transcript_22466/g.32781  ORF Transcript_22466/g.32781 Transcript_22466/m.32781 type:complete len:343 (-) Transcript_22466:164-1192(-)|eukprot:CAMPEP_0185028894 /NCGR_PEP_ID=MMETSP1103-20130426/14962_1 /TAXON_ID=36769 /ORGANISM="Paraphysomonas bandaiensis, Strain Caron Lab Isolate" /LENGTH=342 /DNA_ID=CAMNT_0027563467 /DNA_START=40 /DNA_END=1068 /DNA_ORIENTATION=+
MKCSEPFHRTLRDSSECHICLDPEEELLSLGCGHSMCATCVKKHHSDKTKHFICPFCKSKRAMPKSGFKQNVSLNHIRCRLNQVPEPCPAHLIYSLHYKCLSCKDHPLVCSECIVNAHLAHLVVSKDQSESEALRMWHENTKDLQKEPQEASVVCEGNNSSLGKSDNTSIINIEDDDEDTDSDSDESVAAEPLEEYRISCSTSVQSVMRGDCVLYVYVSREDGERYLGIGFVRRVYHTEAYAATRGGARPSRKRSRDGVEYPLPASSGSTILRISPVTPVSNDGSDMLSGAILRPDLSRTVDVPAFSVISTSMKVNMTGSLCMESIEAIKKANAEFCARIDC